VVISTDTALFTTTVAYLVTEPAAFEATNTYSRVTAGVTILDPLASTVPIPSLIQTSVASDVVQARVDDWPSVIGLGVALKVAVGNGLTVTVTLLVAWGPALMSVAVIV